MTITILGSGYAGLSSAAVFAAAGIRTFVVDVNAERLASVRAGKSFFYEEGLDALLGKAVAEGLLTATDSYAACVPNSDVVISAVGTPDRPDGSTDLDYIFAAADEAVRHMKPGTVFVQKSTVPVGTGAQIAKRFAKTSAKVAYVSSPEFLREGTSLSDTLWFDRVVVGGDNTEAIQTVISLYKHVERKRDEIATLAGLHAPVKPPEGRYTTTSLASAELIKVTANTFLTLKISFANSIAKLADASSADVVEVMDAVGADPRIGRAFLNAGRGYGGGCFPKDASGLIASSRACGVGAEIIEASQAVNNSMPAYVVEKLRMACGGELRGKRVAVLGLAFKAGTSDMRKSPGVAIAKLLREAEADVVCFDPEANDEAQRDLPEEITLAPNLEKALQGADGAVLATDWPVFVQLPAAQYATLLRGDKVLLDAMNALIPNDFKASGVRYIGIGRGETS